MKKMLYFSAAALLMATNSWADDSPTVTKVEFNALKRQVARLEKKLAKKHTKEKTQTTHSSAHKSGPQKLFAEDGYHGTTFWEAQNNNDFPRIILTQRNAYGNSALALGGYIEAEPISSWWGNTFRNERLVNPNPLNKTGTLKNPGPSTYGNGSGIGISAATIDIMANAGNWTQAFMETDVSDGAVLLSAFITIGNLDKTPFYLSFGKFRARFGRFPGGPWISSIPQGIFRPGRTYNAMLGYSGSHLDGYLIYMPTIDGQQQNLMGTLFYNAHLNQNWRYEANASFMSNILASENEVGVVLKSVSSRATPAADVDTMLGYKRIAISGGFMSTLRNATITNNRKATAWWAAIGYTMPIFAKQVTFAVNYSKASNTQNIPMPLAGDVNRGPELYGVKDLVFAYASTSITRNILIGLEYGLMTTYSHQKTNEITGYTAFYF